MKHTHIKKAFLYVCLGVFIFSFSACNNDSDDFKEVSKLISKRSSARYKKAAKIKERKQKKPAPKPVQPQKQETEQEKEPEQKQPGKKKFSTEIFYEEEIKIVGSSSNSTLGVGTAYLNKDGKIVQIKIKRN